MNQNQNSNLITIEDFFNNKNFSNLFEVAFIDFSKDPKNIYTYARKTGEKDPEFDELFDKFELSTIIQKIYSEFNFNENKLLDREYWWDLQYDDYDKCCLLKESFFEKLKSYIPKDNTNWQKFNCTDVSFKSPNSFPPYTYTKSRFQYLHNNENYKIIDIVFYK